MTPETGLPLRRGSRGAAVAAVCERLELTGDLPRGSLSRGDRAAAVFDERVDEAVRAFQQRRGLLVDGIVGPSTYAILDGARWSLGDRVLRHLPDHLHEGDDVVGLQERLVGLGFKPGKVDGIFGSLTESAVRAFQTAVGLSPDGTVGPHTMRALQGLARSVSGGSANALREREHLRRGSHSLAGRTVVLDPGHGGSDEGVTVPGTGASGGSAGSGGSGGAVDSGVLSEARLALDLARRIEGRLSAHGVEVVFTRTDHTDAGNDKQRADFANLCGADLLLSLHTDHSTAGHGQGVATFFYGQDAGGWSTIGERFADLVQREVVARTGLTDCRIHARSWTLLRRTRMPAVRLDFGYLSHPTDAAALARPETLDRIAEGVVVALQRMYLGEDDTGQTGLLRLADLRRHLAELRTSERGTAGSDTGELPEPPTAPGQRGH